MAIYFLGRRQQMLRWEAITGIVGVRYGDPCEGFVLARVGCSITR